MPFFKAILLKASENSNQIFCTKSMQCINMARVDIGKDKFIHDAKELMEMLMNVHGSQIDIYDLIMSYIFEVLERHSKVKDITFFLT